MPDVTRTEPASAPRIHLSDYRPWPWTLDRVELRFALDPHATRVRARLHLAPRDGAEREGAAREPFTLHGEDLRLISAAIDGRPVTPTLTPGGLTIDVPDGTFVLETEVEIDPSANTRLEGLYLSNGMYCTQCEAEGFRRITYYPDRPDVMARFEVTIDSDLPVLLSNGNEVAHGHWVDPWPKPAYLFALVAGDLIPHRDTFTTRSGRDVALAVWVRPGDETKCTYAMDALKRSMAWDEKVYGREYDLDVFNIVAVHDFNMGAMENKGLNIFNASAVLASPETATDDDYERIERIVAHEYFHNWTGNRITCRDWFQLSLKEGLTVFRDQQFMGDMRGHGPKRIQDAILLRTHQFREDAGPLAHPVRPDSFVEINNFYTMTIYEKGAEVIGVLKRLVGDEGWRDALDLYFERHDGDAATVEDWLRVFEDATGRDLSQVKLWYEQAGTPRVQVSEGFADGRYTLTLRQSIPPTPGQPDKRPMPIPFAVGLLSPNGDEVVPTTVLELTEAEQTFHFDGLGARPVPSLNRGFAAPILVERDDPPGEAAFRLTHDSDEFNRWEAGQAMARAGIADALAGRPFDPAWVDGLRAVLTDDRLAPAMRRLFLVLPTPDETGTAEAGAGRVPAPDAIHAAHEAVRDHLAGGLGDLLPALHAQGQVGAYRPDPVDAGRRALGNAALSLLTRTDGGTAARAQFAQASDMTQSLAALSALLAVGQGEAELATFGERWAGDRLVMDKWFALQPTLARPADAVAAVERLTRHPAFDWKNPNRFRAVILSLARNYAGFHRADGAGYRLVADWLGRLDGANPMIAARGLTVFDGWRKFDAARQAQARTALERFAATPDLSKDSREMVDRLLA